MKIKMLVTNYVKEFESYKTFEKDAVIDTADEALVHVLIKSGVAVPLDQTSQAVAEVIVEKEENTAQDSTIAEDSKDVDVFEALLSDDNADNAEEVKSNKKKK
jgi:hypothetical protein